MSSSPTPGSRSVLRRDTPRRPFRRAAQRHSGLVGRSVLTVLSYLPLTNGAVYRRDAGSRNALDWGRGSPVQDFVAPMYVVYRNRPPQPIYPRSGGCV